jgi:hypothetical protein
MFSSTSKTKICEVKEAFYYQRHRQLGKPFPFAPNSPPIDPLPCFLLHGLTLHATSPAAATAAEKQAPIKIQQRMTIINPKINHSAEDGTPLPTLNHSA